MMDFYPTILELAGVALPEGQPSDGTSLVAAWQDEPRPDLAERPLFWHNIVSAVSDSGEVYQPVSAVRRGPWRLVHNFERPPELYNLEDDPGEEVAGYFRLDVEGNEGAVIDVSYAEFMKYGRVPALTHQVHSADRYILKEGRQFHEVNDWKGFRYVQLTVRHLTRPLHINSAAVRTVGYPYLREDRFMTEDGTLNRIWEICDRGRRVCAQDRFVDCPWREQAPWLLDAWLAGKVSYGDARLRGKTIEDFLLSQKDDGRFPTASYSESVCHDQSFTLSPRFFAGASLAAPPTGAVHA
jgi:hypothetical protein